jgi:PAS domain S-box-containing protein
VLAQYTLSAETILEALPGAVIATTVDGAIIYWNRSAQRLFGWPAGEVLGRDVSSVLRTETSAALAAAVMEGLRRGEGWAGTLRLKTREGAEVDTLVVVDVVIREDPREIVALLGISTARERLELPPAIGRGEHFYRDLVDTAQEGIWIADADDRITFVNARLASLLGSTPVEMIGMPRSRFFEPGDAETARTQTTEVRLRRADGGSVWALVESQPLLSPSGELRGTRSSVIDVTRRREAEEHLRDREAQLSQAQRTARIGSWEWEMATNRVHGSKEFFDLLEMPPPRATRTLTDMLTRVHPDDAPLLEETLRRAVLDDVPFDIEYRVFGGSGKVIRSRGQRVIDAAGQPVRVVGIAQDMTDRKRLEERLQQAERVSSIGRLAASVAHEFNNILMGIQPFTELLQRVSAQPDAVRNAASRIADAIARGKRVTQEILKFTRTPEPQRVAINVSGWLRSAEPELIQLAGREVALTVTADPLLHILGDPHQLRQVLANLVANSRDAMPAGGSVHIRAEVDAQASAFVHFTVTDTGAGIPAEVQRLIFEPLFTTKKFGGTGLGLAVAQQIIQHHEGSIWVESTPDAGTTFHILIPATAPRDVVRTEPARRRSVSRIALIEDDTTVAAGLAAVLELEGVSVDVIDRGRLAVARIAEMMPDAVVLDIGLPDIDGVLVYEAIAARWPELPVLFSTGHGDEARLGAILSRPGVGFMQKPYDVEALLDALEELV